MRHEAEAMRFLLELFRHPRYRFEAKAPGEFGFDLWLVDQDAGERTRVELKAHTGTYRNRRSLVDRLIFNSTAEKELFERGDTVLVRVFLGSTPPRVFILTNRILKAGARLDPEPRYVLRGAVNYGNGAYEELIARASGAGA